MALQQLVEMPRGINVQRVIGMREQPGAVATEHVAKQQFRLMAALGGREAGIQLPGRFPHPDGNRACHVQASASSTPATKQANTKPAMKNR